MIRWVDNSGTKATFSRTVLFFLFFKWILFIQVVSLKQIPTSTFHFTTIALSIMKYIVYIKEYILFLKNNKRVTGHSLSSWRSRQGPE